MGCRVKLPFTLLLASMALSHAANPPITLGAPGTGIFLLTDDNRLASVCDTLPSQASPPISAINLAVGDVLVAIDVRPLNQELYGLARNGTTGTFQLYHLSPATGVATAVGPANTLSDSSGAPLPTAASRFGMDFSPVADRLRVVTSSGLNFRINPNTGGCVDGDAGSPGTNPDTAINGGTSTLDEIAYTNNVPYSASTTLYSIDAATDAIYLQSNPNGGLQTSQVLVTMNGGIPVNFSAARGFDLAAPSPAGPASGTAYVVLTLGATTGLYRIDLTTGAATLVGTPTGFNVRGLAVRTQIPTAIALNATGANLIRFRTDNPGTASTVATSLGGGETLVAIDFRPSTGQLYGLGINSAANTGSLYIMDAASGGATLVGAASGQVLFVDGAGNPVDLPDPATVGYGFDFNPQTDRVRVVTGSGLNFRINPITGAPIDADALTPGINTDFPINGGSTGATATAYTNSYAGALPTTQYTLDPVSNFLRIQNPPNNGTQTSGVPVTVNGSLLDFTEAAGFDITGEGGTNLLANVPATGHGWAALTVGGVARLYRIDLASGVAVPQGQIGTGAPLAGLAVAAEDGKGFAPLSWTSIPNASYRIETSPNLANWQPYPGAVIANGVFTTVPVPVYDGESRRFWRVVTP